VQQSNLSSTLSLNVVVAAVVVDVAAVCQLLPPLLTSASENGFESRRVGFVAAPCRTVPPRPCPRQSTLHLLRVQGTFLEAALLVIRMFDKSQSCTEAKTTHLSHLSLCSLNVYISPDRYSHPCLCLCIPVSKYPVSSSQSCCKCY